MNRLKPWLKHQVVLVLVLWLEGNGLYLTLIEIVVTGRVRASNDVLTPSDGETDG